MRTIILLLTLWLAGPAFGAATKQAVPGAAPPAARIADLAWLAGIWEGEGLTGPAREVYLEPMGGQMAGHFTQTRGGGIGFYEIVTIVEKAGSLEYRLRHFNADLTGWEEKDKVHAFPLVAVEKDAWYFDGLTVRRDGKDGMIGAVLIQNRDGSRGEKLFRYRRAR
jgi:hypothetical protein